MLNEIAHTSKQKCLDRYNIFRKNKKTWFAELW